MVGGGIVGFCFAYRILKFFFEISKSVLASLSLPLSLSHSLHKRRTVSTCFFFPNFKQKYKFDTK